MQSDPFGSPVTGSPEAIAAVNAFLTAFLAYEERAGEVVAAADRLPGCPILDAYAGMLCMLMEAPQAPAYARVYLARAQRAAGEATARERRLIQLLARWVEDDIPAVLAICDAVLDDQPADLLTAKIAHYHQFNRGDSPAMLRTILKVLPHLPEVAEAHAMAAFAYEQCHLMQEAETAARRSLDLKRQDPWAQHALAHVMLTQGRIDEGVAFMEGARDTWSGLNSFMLTHLWWHLALFYLSLGREADALAAYDEQCWAAAKDYSQDQIGAVSLLARLEIAGVNVGDRWQDLANHLAVRADDTVQPFLTLQYLYGLARAGRPEADRLLDAIRRAAAEAPEHSREAWLDIALPAAEGLAAQARGDHEMAVRRLRPALPRMIEIGGSHAQRDFFEQVLLDAVVRSGRFSQAQQMLEARRAYDPDGVPLNRTLAGVYDRLGLPEQAAAARNRVERRLAAQRAEP